MLIQLTIRNYALIRHLELQPADGLNVITGETGAGKSIMLGALGLLSGNRADPKVLWDEAEKCVTEAEFDISAYQLRNLFRDEDLDYDDHTVVRREIGVNGKSRAFINDSPVTLDVLKKVASRLMDIHSQHETLELGSRSFQLKLIDAFAGNTKVKTDYEHSWKDFVAAQKAYDDLQLQASSLNQEADFIRFQLNELQKADLKESEQIQLESELKVQENAEEIRSRLNAVQQLLSISDFSVKTALTEVKSHLTAIAAFAEPYSQLLLRVDSIRIELDDILGEVEHEESSVEFDRERLDVVNGRLSTIYALYQKHRVQSVSELLSLQQQFQDKADTVVNLDSNLETLRQQAAQLKLLVDTKSEILSKTRTKIFATLSKQLMGMLSDLGIPEGQIKVQHDLAEPGPSGKDNIEILFSANKGIAPRPLAQVASGGEFSRLMFAVKYVLAEKTAMPTLILDEIDTGISGEIAISLGRMLKEMAANHQVIAISHLPQIAAKGDKHFFVFKDSSAKKTISTIRELDGKERVEEIAKMIGGARPTASAVQSAKELIGS
jgi:DNA repair protein RecN (Recombination protein N)